MKNNKLVNLIVLLCSFVLPVLFLLSFFYYSNLLDPFKFLWIGFYSSIIMMKYFEKKTIYRVMIRINIFFIFFTFVLSLMGGLQSVLLTFIKMIIPFIPADWLWDVIVKVWPVNY